MAFRILASVALLFSILFLPFYISLILALAGIIYFSFFFEAVILLFISDLLYGAGENKLFHAVFVSLLVSVLLLLLAEFLKRKMKSYF